MTDKVDTLWSGRFSSAVESAVETLNASIPYDWRLAPFDLWQNQVYAAELQRIEVLSQSDYKGIDDALETIKQEIRDGALPYKLELEDIHMNLEARLTALVGDAGRRIHTGRSRNDQVATVFRLWLRDAIDLISANLQDLIKVTLDQAETFADQPIPGYTHLQRAQIVTFGHHLHAYAEMLVRDLERLSENRQRVNVCPLGSGALAGSPYPLDRNKLATELDFDRPTANSMDAVSDRDFALEFLHSATLLSLHLSRWAEDLILWMSSEFQWVALPDAFCTGSSIMPQKKNPDLAELVRGKAGRILGRATGLAATLKATPLTYNKDLQEDKEPVFDVVHNLLLILSAWTPMIQAMEIRPEAMAKSIHGGHLLATDLADYLVQDCKVPFREAHHIVGQTVQLAESLGVDISDLDVGQLQSIDSRLGENAKAALDPQRSLSSRKLLGGPAPAQAKQNVAHTRDQLKTILKHEAKIPWAFELQPPTSWSY